MIWNENNVREKVVPVVEHALDKEMIESVRVAADDVSFMVTI